MKIFILWIMLTSGKGVAIDSQNYNSLEACTSAEMQLHRDFSRAANWAEYSVSVTTSCTEK